MSRRLFETLFRGGCAYLGVYCISFQVESQARTIECYVSHLLSPFQAFSVDHALGTFDDRGGQLISGSGVGRVRQDA
jgi:hypothetical protein